MVAGTLGQAAAGCHATETFRAESILEESFDAIRGFTAVC
jgi:hypothetical protein